MLASVGVDRAGIRWGRSSCPRVGAIVLASGEVDRPSIGWGRSRWHRVGTIVLASGGVDRAHTRENDIGFCCICAKHISLLSKSKSCLARNQDNVSKWSDISTYQLLLH